MTVFNRLAALFVAAFFVAQPIAGQPAAPPPPAAPAAAAPSAATGTARIPVEDFAQLPFFSDPILSPDGMHIAARLQSSDNEAIAIYDLATPDRPPRIIAPGQYMLGAIRWAGDHRLLISVGARTSYNHSSPFTVTRVLSYNLDGGVGRLLGPNAGFFDSLIFVDPEARYVLLSSQADLFDTPSVYRVELETGLSTKLQDHRSGVWNWFADGNGVIRIGVDYSERRPKIYYRATADAPLRRIEMGADDHNDAVIDSIHFLTSSDHGIVMTNAATGRFALYDYDFVHDTRGAVIFERPDVDLANVVLAPDGSVDGVVFEDDRPRVHWLNRDLAALQRQVDGAFPGKTNRMLGRSANGNRILIWSASASDPGTYYIFDRANRRMETFSSPNERLVGHRFAEVRAVTYRSRDGLDIHAYLTLPPGGPTRGLPLVVMPHGGPFIRDSWTFHAEVQLLANRGYAVLQPNFRGSAGYGLDFLSRGYGQFGSGMIDDIEDGADWLVAQGIADRGRVCIMGSSYGGYAALWAAIRSPSRYRCAISFAGPTDMRAMLRYDARNIVPSRYLRQYREWIQGEEAVDLNAISPLRQSARLTVPVLIAHGERDPRVPVAQSRDLVAALRRRGATFESYFYPKAVHGFTTAEDSADFLRRVESFLNRYNPAGATTAPAAAAPSGLDFFDDYTRR
jgi:dipeptidyl aminopeptidase/acylaminoacyl peptidase